ncbi:MAG: hypothetical protein WBQ18_11795, partial [Solirubrobacteraceae bacterium]
AVDPAQPYGAALPWPKSDAEPNPSRPAGRRPSRVAGAYVVIAGGDPIIYLERGGRALQTLVPSGDPRLHGALAALVDHVRSGAIKRLALERVDGEPAMSSPLAPELTELGFQEGPRRLTLSA